MWKLAMVVVLAAGIFARACQAIGGDQTSNTAVKRESVLQEANALTESLTDKLISLKISQGAGVGENPLAYFPDFSVHCV